jgi:hypothetical protein
LANEICLVIVLKRYPTIDGNLWLNRPKNKAYLNESKENTPAKIATIALLHRECSFAAILGEDVSLMLPDCCLSELIDSKDIYLSL